MATFMLLPHAGGRGEEDLRLMTRKILMSVGNETLVGHSTNSYRKD